MNLATLRRLAGVALTVLFAASAVAAPADDRSAAEHVALSYYRAYAGGDVDAALAFWSPKTPSLDLMRRQLQRRLHVLCFEPGRIEATKIAVDGDTATVDVESDWLVSNVMPHSIPYVDFGDATLTLHREADAWRITAQTPAGSRIADALLTATPEQRAAILGSPRASCRSVVRELARRANASVNEGKFDAMRTLIDAAMAIANRTGDEGSLAYAWSAESVSRRYIPAPGRDGGVDSGSFGEYAVAHAQRSGDPDAMARAYVTLSRVWYIAENAQAALALRDDVSDAVLLAMAASRMSQSCDFIGDYWSELQYGLLGRRYAEETGDDAAIISAEMNIAATYETYNDYELEAASFKDIVARCEKAGFRKVRMTSELAEARAEIELGHRRIAAQLAADAEREPFTTMQARLFRAEFETDHAKAERLANSVLREASDWNGIAEALQTLVALKLADNRPKEALPYLRRLDAMYADGRGYPRMRFDYLMLAARTESRLGHLDVALQRLASAIDVAEKERSRVLGSARQQEAFTADRFRAYTELVAIRVLRGETLKALAAADETKGRTLLDILRSNRSTFAEVMSPADKQRERNLHERESALRHQLEEANPASRPRLASDLGETRTAIDAFESEIAMKYPRAIPQWASPSPVNPAILRELLPERDMALVEFTVAADSLYAFAITRGASGAPIVRVHATKITSRTLQRRVNRYVDALSRADLDYRADARRLYELLLGPLAAQIAPARVICIVPDGPLWQLPFETLIGRDGHFVVEHAATFYAPSIAVYATMLGSRHDAMPSRGSLFAVADPVVGETRGVVSRLRAGELTPLPDAKREVESVARIVGGKSEVFVGTDASKKVVERDAGGFRILHFATHGVLDDVNPMYSHLVLASSNQLTDDGVLETWEMMRMRLNADLAVLSACDTARGAYREGEGVVGMSWALFVAGCPSTIATEWKIASAPAADLVISFYKQWTSLGTSPFAKARALAAAKRSMLRQKGRRHPFYWAAFILVGVG